MIVGVFGPLDDNLDSRCECSGHLRCFGFRTSGPANPVEVLNHIANMQRIERQYLRLLGQSDAYLGNLPRRDGSNFADGLCY